MEVLDLSRPKPIMQSTHSTPSYSPMYSVVTPHHVQWPPYSHHHHHHPVQYISPHPVQVQPATTPETDPCSSPIDIMQCDLPQTSPLSSTGSSSDFDKNSKSTSATKRPFKLISSISKAAPLLSSIDTDMGNAIEYEQFRKKVLSQFDRPYDKECNKNMRRTIATNAEKSKDPEYIEKRKKNNEAAKRSREARKAREDELAIRVAYLEQENMKLKFQLALIERQKKMYMKQTECI
ncbi:uncharacterized protein LOC143204557 isoform X2 [Rhynchophorus ferrugineus]